MYIVATHSMIYGHRSTFYSSIRKETKDHDKRRKPAKNESGKRTVILTGSTQIDNAHERTRRATDGA